MISNASLSARRPGVSFLARSTPALGVIVLAAASAVVHGVLTLWHTSPRFFPDEYIYSAISHSIGHGHLLIRGHPANFPAILQPLLAAPAWRFLSPRDAYHVIQLGNAVMASLVVVPLWILGRRLDLSRLVIWLACLLAVTVPSLALIPATIADFVAYPFAVGAVAAAVVSLDEPTKKRQVVFLLLALIATLGKVQYFVLVPAYLVGAVVLDRRRALRRHPIAFAGVAPALFGAIVGILGYYSLSLGSFDGQAAKWVAIGAFLVAAPIAVAIVPGALVAFLRPANRVQSAFGVLTLVFAVLLLIETSVPAGAEGRFKERYLFALLPLLALGFGVYLKNGRGHIRIVLAVLAAILIAIPVVPFASYTQNAWTWDSMTFDTLSLLQKHSSNATVTAVLAVVIVAGAALALVVAHFGRGGILALIATCAISIALLAPAVHVDYLLNYHSPNPAWVDRAAHGASVTGVSTPSSGKLQLLQQMYWNPGIDDEIVFPFGGIATDAYAVRLAVISPAGVLNAHRYFLFDHTGSQATFWNATPLGSRGWLTLYHASSAPRVRMFIENQLQSGWLSPIVRIRAWPKNLSQRNVHVRFTLSLPKTSPKPVTMRVDKQRFVVRPGSEVRLDCGSSAYPVTVLMSSTSYTIDNVDRPVSVQLSQPGLVPGASASVSSCAATH